MRQNIRPVLALMLAALSACAVNQPPVGQGEAAAERQNLELIRSAYDAFGRGDVPGVLGIMDPAIEWTAAEGSPYAGTYRGPDAVLNEVFMKLGTEWEGFQAVPQEFVADEDKVVVLGTYSGTYRQTGRSFQAPFAHVWWIRDGKAVRFHQHTDTELVQRALRPSR